MSVTPEGTEKVDRPAQALQELIARHTLTYIPTHRIRSLIKAHFDKLSMLTHQIHDEEVEFAKADATNKDEN